MGKHLLSSKKTTVQFQDHHPGCMWGILQILDYHHWHNIRNVLPHKKHYWGRHARYKRKNLLHNHDEDHQFGVAKAEPLLVRQHSQKLNATIKSSPIGSKKGSRTEISSKEENSKDRVLSFHGESQHLESSHGCVQCKACGTRDTMDYSGKNQATGEHALHLERDGKITEAALNQKLMEAKKFHRDISIKSEKHLDVLEVCRVKKDLFLEFLGDLDVGGKNFHRASNNKARFTKSGSFPLTSQMRNISPGTLEHKQNEIWAFPKGEKLLAGTQTQKRFAYSFAKDMSFVKPMPLESDLSVESAVKRKLSFSSSSYTQGLNHKGWNQMVLHRFKIIKQKIKHAIKELKKSGYPTSVEAMHHRASSEYRNEKEDSPSLDDGVIQEYIKTRSSDETKAFDYDSNKYEVRLIRRTSSLNESLDRYTQLFEQSFNKDIKWHSSTSKSLKLANEDKDNMSGCAPKFSRRKLSLPNLESLGFLLHEALYDTNDIGSTVEPDVHVQRKSVSFPLDRDKSLDHLTETEMTETVEKGGRNMNPSPLSVKIVVKNEAEVSYHGKDTHEPVVGDKSFPVPQGKVEISMTICPSKEVMTTLESSCEGNKISHAEGKELNTRGSSIGELLTELPNEASVHSWTGPSSNTNASATAKGTKTKSDTDSDSNLKYVKDVLEYLGFMGNDDIQMWHTVDQLKTSLPMDLDAPLCHEIESSGEEMTINHYHYRLLFNVVNEVLLEIYERSPTQFLRAFSNRSIRSMHKEHCLLNEVWTRVNSYLSLRPELDQTLDDVVGRDLAKSSGWMNLQREQECVALELGEMIVEDLLDEVIFS